MVSAAEICIGVVDAGSRFFCRYSLPARWFLECLHIAITGTDGVGKSALLNKLAGFEASEASAMGTTTVVPIGVPIGPNEGVTCWDLPSPGTMT